MSGRVLMVVGAGPFQLPAIHKAQAMGLRVLALDGNPDALGLKAADVGLPMDIKDSEACLEVARQHKVNGVLAVASEVTVPTVAYIAEKMKLPGCGTPAAQASTNKAVMRRLFAEHGTPSPRSASVKSLAEAVCVAAGIGYPVVVKPPDSSGSRGVSRVDDAEHLRRAFEEALQYSRKGIVLVEEYVEGDEVAVEGFVVEGVFRPLVVSDKIRTPPPHLLDRTVSFPSTKPPECQAEILSVASAAVKALGIDSAPIHMELLLGQRGPVVVEVAARGAGFHVFTKIVPWVTGVDAVAVQIRMALGERVDVSPVCARGAVLHFPEYPPGKIVRIEGLDEARKIEGVIDLDIYRSPGERMPPLRSGSDRAGHIIAYGENREEAERSVREALERLQVIVDRGA